VPTNVGRDEKAEIAGIAEIAEIAGIAGKTLDS